MMIRLRKIEWVVLLGLLLLSLVPCVSGVLRLVELVNGPSVLPANPRVQTAPLPVVFHIFTSIVFCIIGALQFLPSIRNRHRQWHRLAGRLLVVTGTIAALSGLWMTHYYTFSDELQGELLYSVRIIVGIAMIVFIFLGLGAVLRKRFVHHQAWMIRAYTLGQGAGTQVLITVPFILVAGEPSGFNRDVLMTVAWLINIIVAEKVIRYLNR